MSAIRDEEWQEFADEIENDRLREESMREQQQLEEANQQRLRDSALEALEEAYLNAFGVPQQTDNNPTGANPRGIEYLRETFEWGTFGKNSDEELRSIVLKDISDSHLLHIIGHLILTRRPDTLITMLEEARYRSQNSIFVEDYNQGNPLSF